jgi:polyisoprenyl-teichoic acid--peptidoglycan teichoic acid transferase
MTKKKKWMRIVSFALIVLLLFGGYYVYSMFSFVHTIGTNKMFSTGNQPLNTAKWQGTEPVNILFMGVDRRDPNDRPRSDTMMIASINPTTKKVTLFSIMRDSYVNIPGIGKSKINAAFANGGPELTIDTISQYLNIPIHFYVATDFEGFAKIIDEIGGVDVNVKENMVHPDDGIYDINLKAGQQHLDGQKALMYVRYRGTPRADFDRTAHQREMMQLVSKKLESPPMLLKLPSILKAVEPYTQVSPNLTPDVMTKLLALMLECRGSGIDSVQLPPDSALSEGWDSAGEQVLNVDVPAVQKLVHDKIGADQTQTAQPAQGNGNSGGQQQSQPPQQPQGNNGGAQQKAQGQSAKVLGEYVNVRQKPGTDSNIIGKVNAGGIVTIIEQTGDWDYVQTGDGMYGYIKADLLSPQ